jgi:signal transduction histidine kinase
LTNVARHADSATATLTVNDVDQLTLTVETAAAVCHTTRTDGNGMRGMQGEPQ